MITLPTIHNNGTSADNLLEDNLAARGAIESALDVIYFVGLVTEITYCPNAR